MAMYSNPVLHISFVCTGNICRSPMAEKIFAAYAARAGLAVQVSSAGTYGGHAGNGADPRTVAVLRRYGYPSSHAAALLSAHHLDADLLVTLDAGHDAALAQLGVAPARRRLLRTFDPTANTVEVDDPYYGTEADFELVRDQIEAAIPGLLDWARRNTNSPAG